MSRLLANVLSSIIALGAYTHAHATTDNMYIVSFASNKSTCLLRVNDFPGGDSTLADLRTVSMGFNTTAFLENGVNDVELLMGPMDHNNPDTLYKESRCEVTFTNEEKNHSHVLATFRLEVEKNKIISQTQYDSNRADVGNEANFEGYSSEKGDYGLFKIKRKLTLSGLPEWAWVGATPVTDNDLPAIKAAYESLWRMMSERDIAGLRNISRLSAEELSLAEGVSQEFMFRSNDLARYVEDNTLQPMPIDWKKYRLKTYRGGRLFRMTVGFFENSPLKMMNAEGKAVYAWAPYFSMINGEVVLVR